MPTSLIMSAVWAFSISWTAAAVVVYGALAAVTLYGSSVIMRRYISGQLPGESAAIAQRQQIPPSTTNSIPVVYGDAWLGGTFVDAVLTTDQKTMYYVLTISSISTVGQFNYDTTAMYYGDQSITFDGTDLTKVISLTDGAGNINTKISGFLNIYLYTSDAAGTITPMNSSAAPSTLMGGSDIATAQQWPSTGRQMNGQAFAIVKLLYNSDAGTTSLSPITFKCKHYLNGTGAAKPGDVWLDYMTNSVYGAGATTVDTASATALNTYSDELISFTTAAGPSATQPRYRINGLIDTGAACLGNVDKIMVACDSWMRYDTANGKWSVIINEAKSVDYAFDDNNIMGEISVSVTDINNSINQIEAEFPSKVNRDQRDYVNLYTPTGLLYPNEPLNKYSVKYDLVNDSVQAQYLANRTLEQAREDLVVKINTTYDGIQVDAGDVISLTNAAYGWDAKLFRVVRVNEASFPDGTLGAAFELNEYNPAVYDNYDITAFSPTPNSNLPSPSFFSPLAAPTFADQLPGAAVPSFSVQCITPLTGRVTNITLFYTTVASPTPADWKVWGVQTQPNAGTFAQTYTFKFTQIVLPAATYYFSFSVGNAEGQTNISPTSTSLVWVPVAGAATFLAAFSPATLQVPYTSGAPVFTGITEKLYASTSNGATDFVTAQTDSDVSFVNDSWRIGNSATSGNADISYSSGLTIGSPTDGGTFALFPAPTAMSVNPATMTVPVRYKTVTGTVIQGAPAVQQLAYQIQGATGPTGASVTGPTGTNGTSARITFARVPSNPSPVSGSITTSGSSSYPSSAQSSSTWGFAATWGATDPSPTSTDSLYQADGLYNPATGLTVWTTPYISSLKVGTLSAITANTGALTVSGTLSVSTGAISGSTMTGSGGQINASGTFALGTSTSNLTYNGAAITMNGTWNAGGAQFYMGTRGSVYLGPANNLFQIDRTGLTLLYGIHLKDTPSSAASSEFLYAESNTTAANAYSFNASNTTTITMKITSTGSSSGAAQFYNTGSGTGTKQFWTAPGAYSAYSPSGGGKIYVVDGLGPFTGIHDTMLPIGDISAVGDIMVDESVFYKLDVTNTIFQVATSSTANQTRAIGIKSAQVDVQPGVPAILWESIVPDPAKPNETVLQLIPPYTLEGLQAQYNVCNVNSVGEGQINVCGQNGNIAAGDYIVTSSMAGKGMKQNDDIVHNYTVAKARESVSFVNSNDVQMIACIYLCG